MIARKLSIFLVLLSFFVFSMQNVRAQDSAQILDEQKVSVIVFLRNGCIHCENEDKFLQKLEKERDDIVVTRYRLENSHEKKIWEEFTEKSRTSKVTPITVIGEYYIIGFEKENTTGKEIVERIEQAKNTNSITNLNNVKIADQQQKRSICDENGLVPCSVSPSLYVSLPLIGKIDTTKYPLFLLSAILGFFDGFNPCAMWVLVTFLLILLQVGNRKKMFLFAGTFILAESIMYTLILTVWYKTWDFVQLDTFITPIIGIAAIIGGAFFLREWRKKEIECKVTNLSQRQKTKQKIQELVTGRFTFITILAILGIALSVNIIEFACSIGIPQAFTKILELNNLSFLQTVLFIAVYIFFYMVDDFIVFGIALYGADRLYLTTKYSKLSNLIGGIIMIILGLVLIFKPNILLF